MSDSLAPTTRPGRTAARFNLAISVLLLITLAALQPAMIDGDGMDHASRAVEKGFLEGMEPKHSLLGALLRAVHLTLEALELGAWTLGVFAAVDHLAAVGIYLVLARSLYPRFLTNPVVVRCCALGVVVSYGVLSRASTVEAYALALLADIALVAYCLAADLRTWRAAFLAATLFVLAVGMHITNVLLVPFLTALIVARFGRPGWAVVARVATFSAAAGMALALLMLAGKDASLWPPDLARIWPRTDPEPQQTLTTRVTRSAYGAARSIAYLPPVRELSTGLALGYVAGFGTAGLLACYVGRRGRGPIPGRSALFVVAALVIPFAVMGVAYYPSDPERWLFLLPVFWLGVGHIWDQYQPDDGTRLTPRAARAALGAVVAGLFFYNVVAGLLPEAAGSRHLEGMRALTARTTPDDLVISPAGVTGSVYRYYLGSPPAFRNLTLLELAQRHPADEKAAQEELASLIRGQLARGAVVYVFELIDEGHRRGEGYPWSQLPGRYGPETFLDALAPLGPEPVVPPSPRTVGIYTVKRAPP